MQLFLAAFQSVPDPRAENTRHNLAELLIIAFVAVLCGAQGCAEMAEFGRVKLKFLKRFLKLRNGIPSHDTFSNVFRMLDPKGLDAAFAGLAASLVAGLGDNGVIAIDGTSLKGAHAKGRASAPEMMVSISPSSSIASTGASSCPNCSTASPRSPPAPRPGPIRH